MFVSSSLDVNDKGHLTIGGLDAVSLAEEYATPLYVMDENLIRDNLRRFLSSIEKYYDGNGTVAFASKSFCCKEMCRIVNEVGASLDVASGGEIYTALAADFPPERILFHGNNKTPEELTYAVQNKIGRIVVDNIFELEMLEQIAKAANTKIRVQFRIKPGVEAHTHELVKTGGIDSKFGFALETGEALEAVRATARMENIDLVGLHCHIGSQIFTIEPFEHAAKIMVKLLFDASLILDKPIPELNLGGGFGIQYTPEDDPPPYESYVQSVAGVIEKTCKELGVPTPYVMIEPGRSVAGPAGITLYRVGAIKDIPGIRTYLTVDGGLADNPRPGFYDARYDMIIANRTNMQKDTIYTVSGRCCETDLLCKDIALQQANIGDVLAVFATGAYNYSMASNYNRLPKPAVVFVKDGKSRIAVRRESFEDVIKNDL